MVMLIGEGLAGSEGGWDETKGRRRDCPGAGISFLLIGLGFPLHHYHSLHRYLTVVSNTQPSILSRTNLFVALVLLRFGVG